jgi:hypothetical protein
MVESHIVKRQYGLDRYHLTEHARMEMLRRQIIDQDVARVLSPPEQVIEVSHESSL